MSDQPSKRDLANAAARQEIAHRQNEEYRRVLAWADRIMGPGWLPCGRHYLVDHDEEERARREGALAMTAATVYSVTNGASKRHFIVRDDRPVEVSGYKEAFGAMLLEPHPTRGFVHKGELVHTHRYSLCWAACELYEPRTAEQLATLRTSRERGKAAREERQFQQDNPLLAWSERQAKEDEGPEGGRSGP